MTSAYILVVAVLILGGLIAALGDRIGTKVGKARLRLFQLRPKQTAIVITIGTGILISASTLLILFSLSSSLRQGIFELDEILQKRREITLQLETVEKEKAKVEKELINAQTKQNSARELLSKTGKELVKTQAQLKSISSQSEQLKKDVLKIIAEKSVLLAEKEAIQKQREKLEKSIAQRDQELKDNQLQIEEQRGILEQQKETLARQKETLAQQKLSLEELKNRQNQLQSKIKSRDEQIANLDKNILAKDKILKDKETELLSLEKELAFYRREVEILEQYYQTYQDLRERPIAVVKGQVLTVTLVKTDKNTNLEELIDGILNEANRGVMLILGYGNQSPNQRFVQITKGQVEQMKQQLSENGEYLVRILSASNYVQGEESVRIFADVTPNQQVYAKNETIASISLEPKDFKSTELQQKLDFLISVTQFRARREGILGKIIIGDGKIISLINFIQELELSEQAVTEIMAIAANNTNTSGPLQINLVVISNGQEILRL